MCGVGARLVLEISKESVLSEIAVTVVGIDLVGRGGVVGDVNVKAAVTGKDADCGSVGLGGDSGG